MSSAARADSSSIGSAAAALSLPGFSGILESLPTQKNFLRKELDLTGILGHCQRQRCKT